MTLLLALAIQSCATFSSLPASVEKSTEIVGVYSNDCDSTDSFGKRKLWQLIDYKDSIEEDNLIVRFEVTENHTLNAFLFRDNEVIAEKLINGKFKKDNCYYTRRDFYFVPILPILWWYSDDRERIYFSNESLIFEETYSTGGILIIMASGHNGNHKSMFNKVEEKVGID